MSALAAAARRRLVARMRALPLRRELAATLGELDCPPRNVVVLAGYNVRQLVRVLSIRCPAARVHVVPLRTGSLIRQLQVLPEPDLVLDADSSPARVFERLRQHLFFLADGGTWLTTVDVSKRLTDAMHTGPPDEFRLAVARTDRRGNVVAVRKQGVHRIKLRDDRANDILRRRYGTSWGEVVATFPPTSYAPRVEFVPHSSPPAWPVPWDGSAINVPELYLRRYENVLVLDAQRVAKDNLWLPDTFRHPQNGRLFNRGLERSAPVHARLRWGDDEPTRTVDGPLFHFDTEHPGHYGHITTEVVGRVWGWTETVARVPDIRPLMSLRPGEEELPSFVRSVLTNAGVDLSRVELVRYGECVRVRELYAASPMFVMPHYVSPALPEVWRRIGDVARAAADLRGPTPRRLFVARRLRRTRSCANSAEIENFFAGLGFDVMYPEDHSFEDQVALCSGADVIAGFAGSGLFTTMFAGPKRMINIGCDSYTANNEWLIAAANGGVLHRFVGDSRVKQPDGSFARRAYLSNFFFDLERHGDELRETVESLALAG